MKTRFIPLALLLISLVTLTSFKPEPSRFAAPYLVWDITSASDVQRTVASYIIRGGNYGNYASSSGVIPPGGSVSGQFAYEPDWQNLTLYMSMYNSGLDVSDVIRLYNKNHVLEYTYTVSASMDLITIPLPWLDFSDELHVEISPY